MRQILLTKEWAGRSKDAVVDVWQPGDELVAGMVDPGRAAQLVNDGFAEEVAQPEPAAETKRAKTPKTPKKARG